MSIEQTITASPGDHLTIDVNRNQSLTNTLLDVTADNSSIEINCADNGEDWVIRNVGWRGTNDFEGDGNSIHVTGAADGVIENVYMGDGATGTTPSALFVNADFSGLLVVRNVYCADYNTGFYASAPGNPPIDSEPNKAVGAGGVIGFEECYLENIDESGYKIGSSGSYARGCKARNVWTPLYNLWEDCTFEECDVVATDTRPVAKSGYTVDSSVGANAVTTLTNVRGTATNSPLTIGPGEFIGSVEPNPDMAYQGILPLSASEAASGEAVGVTLGGITFDKTIFVTPMATFRETVSTHAEEGALLVFPENTGSIPSGDIFVASNNYNKLGIYTQNNAKTNVVIDQDMGNYLVAASWMDYFYMRGFNLDHGPNGNNGSGIRAYAGNRHVLQDVTIQGGIADHSNSANGFAVAARPNATCFLERCIEEGRGTSYHGNGNGRIGIWSGNGYNEGRIHIKNCRITDSCNNGIYASNMGAEGWVHVEGGIFENSYGGQVRTGGNGTIIEDIYMEFDMDNSLRSPTGGQSGIRYQVKGDSLTEDGVIRNVHCRHISGSNRRSIRLQQSSKHIDMQDIYVEHNNPDASPRYAVHIAGEGEYKFPPPTGYEDFNDIHIDNLNVSGTFDGATDVYIGPERDGMTISNSHIPGNITGPGTAVLTNVDSEVGTAPMARPSLPPVGEDPALEPPPDDGGGGDPGDEPPEPAPGTIPAGPLTTEQSKMMGEIRRRWNS